MPVAFFQTKLVLETAGGSARLLVPEVMRKLDYSFVLARDGGEAIIRVEAPAKTLERVAEDAACTRLTPKEAEKLRENYPPPRLKQRYRIAADEAGVEQQTIGPDGNPLVEILQTVRAGFHLVDLPLTSEGAPDA